MATPAKPLRNYNWEGQTLIINDRTVRLSKQLSDRYAHPLGQRVAVVIGKDNNTGEPVVVKIRYELVL